LAARTMTSLSLHQFMSIVSISASRSGVEKVSEVSEGTQVPLESDAFRIACTDRGIDICSRKSLMRAHFSSTSLSKTRR